MNKKIVSSLAALAVFLMPFGSANAADAGSAIEIASVTADAGKDVQVPINITANSGIIAMSITVDYDAANLKLTKVEDKGLFADMTYTGSGSLDKVPYRMMWDSLATANYTNVGELAVLTLHFADNAAAGEYPIKLVVEQENTFDVNLDEVAFTAANGKITVGGGVVTTTSEAPVVTTTQSSVVTTSEATVVTTSGTPAVTTSEAPVVTTSGTPAVTTSEAPVVTTSGTPAVTTSEAPVVTTSEAPASSSISETTASAVSSDSAAASVTTSEAASTVASTEATTEAATTAAATTAAVTTTSAAATTAAASAAAVTTAAATYSNDDLCSMAVKDYVGKNEGAEVTASAASNTDGTVSITLTDKSGKTVAVYTVDPATGKGVDAAGAAIDLPQTGITGFGTYAAVGGAFAMLAAGAWLTAAVARKKDEE